jgi:hypothetical protein
MSDQEILELFKAVMKQQPQLPDKMKIFASKASPTKLLKGSSIPASAEGLAAMQDADGEVFMSASRVEKLEPKMMAVWEGVEEVLRQGHKHVVWFTNHHGVGGEVDFSFPLKEMAKLDLAQTPLAASTLIVKVYARPSSTDVPGKPRGFHLRHISFDPQNHLTQLDVGGKIKRVSHNSRDLIRIRAAGDRA